MTPCVTLLTMAGADLPIIVFIIAMVGDTIIITTAMLTGVIHP